MTCYVKSGTIDSTHSLTLTKCFQFPPVIWCSYLKEKSLEVKAAKHGVAAGSRKLIGIDEKKTRSRQESDSDERCVKNEDEVTAADAGQVD